MSRLIATLLCVSLLTLAGCSGGLAPGSGSGSDGGSGTVNLYVSDQPGALEDFEHLNVTITAVAFHHANTTEGDANVTANGEVEGDAEWTRYEVENRTVDLTELAGDNATLVGQYNLSNGTYDSVFVHVGEVEGTLASDGSQPNVRLPSDRLHITQDFTVGDGEEVDFVFDMMVVKAGQSGQYNIRPVVSESGTDQAITEVDATAGASASASAGGASGDADADVGASAGNGQANETDGGYAVAIPR